jgi:uncharacterized protein YuzB (UPF0349 family)
MRPIIEFCNTNRQHGTSTLFNTLEANPAYDVLEYGCLGNCGECYANPYALVNGIIVSGSSLENLQQNIEQAVSDYMKLFDDVPPSDD